MLHLFQAYVVDGYKTEWGVKENPHETKIPHERGRMGTKMDWQPKPLPGMVTLTE